MTAQELALIGLWAKADWTRVAMSIVDGKPNKPGDIGGSISRRWKGSTHDAELSVLLPATQWMANGKSITADRHVCSWNAVTQWLRGFTDDERGELHRVYRVFYSAYGYRDDEFGGFTSAESCRRARVYEQRMRDGAWEAMDGCVARFQEIVRPHLDAALAYDETQSGSTPNHDPAESWQRECTPAGDTIALFDLVTA